MQKLEIPTAAIVFDFDGTLVDSVDIKVSAFTNMFSSFGPEILEKVRRYQTQNGFRARTEKIRFIYKEFLEKKITDLEVNELCDKYSSLIEELVIGADFVPGAWEFLEKNFQKFRIFLASATPQAELDRIILKRGMLQYFTKSFGSPTTKPQAVDDILTRFELRPSEVLFVGDSVLDYEAALEKNCPFVAVSDSPNLFRVRNEFPKAIAYIHNILELTEIVEF